MAEICMYVQVYRTVMLSRAFIYACIDVRNASQKRSKIIIIKRDVIYSTPIAYQFLVANLMHLIDSHQCPMIFIDIYKKAAIKSMYSK